MTHAQRTAAVRASLLVDDARETHHTIYPVRGRETGHGTVDTRRTETVPGAALAAAVAYIYSAGEFYAAVDAGPHEHGESSRLRQWCAFCESFSWCAWFVEDDTPGCWACEDEAACHARVIADA